jgi:hypothetical protein
MLSVIDTADIVRDAILRQLTLFPELLMVDSTAPDGT